MKKLITNQKIQLKNNSEINEAMIQEFIFNDPSVLGLGELTSIRREKTQPAGGRLDILLADSDNNNRYEVEVQLGATDPSHIVRTIEYWDSERKRYPQYDHCAVIVSEDITSRFMNVISLFNGSIPLVAIQLSAYKSSDDVQLVFTKVLDRVSIGTDEEEQEEVTDRAYWEKRSTTKIMKNVDDIFKDLSSFIVGYELKYNKFYIGLSSNGLAKNFIHFKPKKNFLYLKAKCEEDPVLSSELDKSGLEFIYVSKDKIYQLRLNNFSEYEKNKELIHSLVKTAMHYFNIEIAE